MVQGAGPVVVVVVVVAQWPQCIEVVVVVVVVVADHDAVVVALQVVVEAVEPWESPIDCEVEVVGDVVVVFLETEVGVVVVGC